MPGSSRSPARRGSTATPPAIRYYLEDPVERRRRWSASVAVRLGRYAPHHAELPTCYPDEEPQVAERAPAFYQGALLHAAGTLVQSQTTRGGSSGFVLCCGFGGCCF